MKTMPHGSGDIHTLLHLSGLTKGWMAEGYTHMYFLQDTNPLMLHTAAATIGVAVQNDLDMTYSCVPRSSGEAVGGVSTDSVSSIAHLSHPDPEKQDMTCSLDAHTLQKLVQAQGSDPDDMAKYPGSINQFCVKIKPYRSAVKRCFGDIPEVIRPKFADETKTIIDPPIRPETRMEDVAQLLAADAKSGFVVFDRYMAFSPVINNHAAALVAKRSHLPDFAACTSEMAYYNANTKLLDQCGMLIEPSVDYFFNKLPALLPPRVCLYPIFAPTNDRVMQCVHGGSITQRSSLIVEGDNITIENLELDGCLWIKSSPGTKISIRNLVVINDGWFMTPTDGVFLEPQPVHREAAWLESAPTGETRQMRGFVLNKRDSCKIHAGENMGTLYVTGFMGRHKDCPAGVIIEGNLLDQGQDDLTDEEYAERKPQAGWATGRGVGSVVPQDARSHPELLLTEEEISHIQDLFRAIDLNGNGVLEKRELFHFCEENARMTTRMMTEIDANSDGKVTIDEWVQLFQTLKFKFQLRVGMRFVEEQLAARDGKMVTRTERRLWKEDADAVAIKQEIRQNQRVQSNKLKQSLKDTHFEFESMRSDFYHNITSE